jgi:hypothetical protein
MKENSNASLSDGNGDPSQDFWTVTLEYTREILVKVEDAARVRANVWEQAQLAPR